VKNPAGQMLGHLPATNGTGHVKEHLPSNKNWPSGQAIQVLALPKQPAHWNEQYLQIPF